MALNAQFITIVFVLGCLIVSGISIWIWMQGPPYRRRTDDEFFGDFPNVPKHPRWPREDR